MKLCLRALPLVLLAVVYVQAGEDKKTDTAKIDPKATAVLHAAIDYINATKSYSTTLTYQSVVDAGAGKKKETTAKYDVTVERPNKLALVIKDGKLRCTVLSDGKTLCVYAPPIQKYMQKEAPKTLAEIFDMDEMNIVNQDLNNLLFLDQFNIQGAFEKIMEGVVSLKYAGIEDMGASKAHHLKFSQESFEWGMWIEAGDKPLLRKVAIEAKQKMQDPSGPIDVTLNFTATFEDWKIDAEVPGDRFTFTPPAEAKKVDSFIQKQDQEYDPKLKGVAAPELKGKLLDGGEFDLASAKGKNVVVLDFWATWCGPCRMGMPVVSEIVAQYKDKGVLAYAVNLGEDAEKLKDFRSKTPALTIPILMDLDNKIGEAYRVQPIPMTVLVGKDGIVQQVHMGIPRDLNTLRKTLTAELDTLVAGGSLLKDEKKDHPEKGNEDHEKK